jgi:hypothetical protein
MTRPFFSRDRISNLDIFSRHSEDALGIIKASQGVAFDYQDLVFRFTLDSAAEFLFGVRVDSLRGDETRNILGPALSRLQHAMAQRSRTAPIWPLFEMRKDKTREDLKLVHGFIGPIIEAALDKKKSGLKTNETLLDELVQVTDGGARFLVPFPQLIFGSVKIRNLSWTRRSTFFLQAAIL